MVMNTPILVYLVTLILVTWSLIRIAAIIWHTRAAANTLFGASASLILVNVWDGEYHLLGNIRLVMT